MKELVLKSFFAEFLIFCFLIIKTIFVYALNVPSFGTCPNPGGTVLASYNTGVHGIVGDSTTHTGSDSVHQTSNTTVVQCYCPTEGTNGIKTDWWNVAGLSKNDIKGLQNSGWIYVPNGADWGLSSAPYLALNSGFTCNPIGGNTNSSGNNGGETSNSGANSGNVLGALTSNDPGSNSSGQVLGSSTNILADTSSNLVLLRVLIAIFIALGVFITALI